MPAARESLLDAAFTALADRPWTVVRMVDVALAAGVSRQTLYNEFGSKDGLARALVRREAEAYLTGVERALSGASGAVGPNERLAAAAGWTVRAAAANPLVRAVLTGCWDERLPSPQRTGIGVGSGPAPSARRPGVPDPLPSPVELLGEIRDRAVRLLAGDWPQGGAADLSKACETAARLALSCVVAPVSEEEVESLVRGALA
ncbi:TetR/AcrR family transcriptional regulator [Streptomyces sp. ME19-01-6]|uniref:TetR/AcrR family transcriptional regulator n=1 Tax=Streptomyces sp. ME19-01-6 TaxID=3028686 RepID=UPI00299FF81E|nr:TetR/AcrR family transcriptional regulator [Streptomyces sp. ME19-01-6]MDX3225706.1 TetR/AcrR family transcriptional regulator [Streptomyces sp. ME19-01-6]